MPKAHEVATELRKMADSLDKNPDIAVQQCWISFVCNTREIFLNTCRLMPRPAFKEYSAWDERYPKVKLGSKDFSAPIHWAVSAPRDVACRIVKPTQSAEYDCDSLLSPEEDATLEEATA